MLDQKALAINKQSDDIRMLSNVSFQIFYRTGNIFSVKKFLQF